VWDLDAVSPTVLVMAADKSGKMIPALLHAGKIGYLYVHDRKDCSLMRLSDPIVSQDGMPGRRRLPRGRACCLARTAESIGRR
jgi:alcohol dehydrogenase (cytochrome c)